MFRVKICGITNVPDAQVVAAAGADAVGLNFYEPSPRCASLLVAKAIADSLPSHVTKVGLFVDAPLEHVREVVAHVGVDAVQLHGHESPEYLAQLAGVPVIKVFRPQHDLVEIGDYLAECRQRNCLPKMLLIDAYHGAQMGGTGRRADWRAIVTGRKVLAGLPLVLAGGLTPQNVAEAIATVAPHAVDAASGVELSPGKKEGDLVRQFVTAAQVAFEKQPLSH